MFHILTDGFIYVQQDIPPLTPDIYRCVEYIWQVGCSLTTISRHLESVQNYAKYQKMWIT